MFTSIDLAAAFRTSLAPDLASVIASYVIVGSDGNFSPTRDATRFVGGIYAMQGIDSCAAVQGRFDVASMVRAADARVASGALVKSHYADTDVYTSDNVGFVPLTGATLLVGNETGLRRSLDRLRHARLARSVPRWMVELSERPDAHVALAADFGADGVATTDVLGRSPIGPSDGAAAALPAVEIMARSYPFLNGLRVLRAQGVFAAPGLNLVGTLTYDTDARAENGSASLAHVADINPVMNVLVSVGLGATIVNPRVERSGRDVAFSEPVDEQLVRAMLGYIVGARRA